MAEVWRSPPRRSQLILTKNLSFEQVIIHQKIASLKLAVHSWGEKSADLSESMASFRCCFVQAATIRFAVRWWLAIRLASLRSPVLQLLLRSSWRGQSRVAQVLCDLAGSTRVLVGPIFDRWFFDSSTFGHRVHLASSYVWKIIQEFLKIQLTIGLAQ